MTTLHTESAPEPEWMAKVRREIEQRMACYSADVAAAMAHRGCCGSEDDPQNGKLHGYCVVCGVPWPCDTAKYFLRAPIPDETGDSREALSHDLELVQTELDALEQKHMRLCEAIRHYVGHGGPASALLEAISEVGALSDDPKAAP